MPTTLLIPDSLPPPEYAPALIELIAGTAQTPSQMPQLLKILQTAQATLTDTHPLTQGCTALESWLLTQAGFTPSTPLNLSSGLAPLLHPQTQAEAIWLAQLSHIQIGQSQVGLLAASQVPIDQTDSQTLLASCATFFNEFNLHAQWISPHLWQITGVDLPKVASLSPALACQYDVNTWWLHDPAAKPWRLFLNSLQMHLHVHPINQHREQQGLPVINTLHLFGGAAPWQAKLAAQRIIGGQDWIVSLAQQAQCPHVAQTQQLQDGDLCILDQLSTATQNQDWGVWLENFKTLDKTYFTALQVALKSGAIKQAQICLMGQERQLTLSLNPAQGLAKWLPKRANSNWKQWWLPQNSAYVAP